MIVRDVLLVGPWHHDDDRSTTHRRAPTDYDADHVLLRTIRCVNGHVEMQSSASPIFDYGRRSVELGVRRRGLRRARVARAEGWPTKLTPHDRPARRLRARPRPRAHDAARGRHGVRRADAGPSTPRPKTYDEALRAA